MKYSLLLSIDYALADKWNKSIPQAIPKLIGVTKVEKNQKYIIYLHGHDLSVDKMNSGHVQADITMSSPANMKYLEMKDCKIVSSKLSNSGADLLHPVMECAFKPKDQFGKYKISARVRDLTDNTSETLEQELELVKFKFDPFPNSEEAFDKWYNEYHEQPAPEKAISAFFYWLSTDIYHQDVGDFPPVFAFFLEIFRKNAYLVPHLIELFDSQDARVRSFTLYALVQLKVHVAAFFNSLRDENASLYEEVTNINWNYDPYQELTSLLCTESDTSDEQFTRPNCQLDILWGTFFASGSYEPIQRLIDVLQLQDYAEYPDKLKGNTDFSLQEIQNVQLGLAFQAAKFSLGKYCAQHELVRIYCSHHLNYENSPEPIKSVLESILIPSPGE